MIGDIMDDSGTDELLASMDDCGIDGHEDDPATVGKINRFIRLATIHHMRPVKKRLAEIKTSMDDHIRQDEAIHNQIKGAKLILWAIGGALFAIIPLLVTMIRFLVELSAHLK